jgi:hypothetical protein
MLTIPPYITQYYPKFTKFISDYYEFNDSAINFDELLKTENFGFVLDSFELNLDLDDANRNLLIELGYAEGTRSYYQKPKNVIDIEFTIPEFVTDAYPRFVSFIESYYQFLESGDNFLATLESFEDNLNPSKAANYYLDKLLDELGLFDTSDVKLLFFRKNLLCRFIKEFNSSKGSKESFKILHKLLFNSECDITYPREKLFSSSSSEFVIKHIVIITTSEIQDFVSTYPTKAFSGNYISSQNKSYTFTTGIEAISFKVINGVKYAKLEIVKPEIDFLINEKVTVSINGTIYEEEVVPITKFEILSGGKNYKRGDRISIANSTGSAIVDSTSTGGFDSVQIITPGTGYQIGDVISLTNIPNDFGYGFLAIVSAVTSTSGISKILVINNGNNYSIGTIDPKYIIIRRKNNLAGTGAVLNLTSSNINSITGISIIDNFINIPDNSVAVIASDDGSDANIVTKKMTNYNEPGYNINNFNTLGQNYIIQNMQTHLHEFAYSIESDISVNYVDDIIENYLHPAGLSRYYKVSVK